ncbi:MAG TPA: hypothetical protein VMT16_00310, partial [Thermoanaerobaculia bacterium]|nr:hypothetical protein [Thermoanaerobaculia bacterium]
MSAPGDHRPAAEHGVEHQPFDAEIRIRTILWIGAGLGGLAILGALVGWGLLVMLRGWHQRAEPPAPVIPEARQAPMVPGPRLLATPERELAALRAAEEEALHAYRWLDQQGGVASIPVERAIELALERGIPAAPVAGAPPDP